MLAFLNRRDPTKEAAEMAASLVGSVLEFAGWWDKMSHVRLATSAVLTLWASQVMRMATNLDTGFVGEEALKLRFCHRTPEAEEALRHNAVLLHERLRLGPLHDQCCQKFARCLLEADLTHLRDLARETLPELEVAVDAVLASDPLAARPRPQS